MCDPVTLGALTIASSAASIAQQNTNASAMRRFGRQMQDANTKVAEDDAIRSYAALQTRQTQESAKAAQAITAASLENARRASASRTSAGESGLAGTVIQESNNAFAAAELNYQTTVIRNKAMLDAQFGSELEGVQLQEKGRILSGVPNAVPGVDALGGMLAGFGKALEINMEYKKNGPVG